MGISTFKGGVHPYDGKDLAKDQPIRRIKPKEILVYPLSQHIGAPASPIVAVGDTVLRGQKIAEAGGFPRERRYRKRHFKRNRERRFRRNSSGDDRIGNR